MVPPHVREDDNQELGLYGTIVVVPEDPDYWPPAHRELALTLDDILLEDDRVAPFLRSGSTHTAMGRFGDVLLVNGEPEPSFRAERGEVVRLYLTDTANTRVFRVGVRGARMKLVGGDSGHVEHERIVDTVVLGPSERAVVDVLFDAPGSAALEHRTPTRTYRLATVEVTTPEGSPPPPVPWHAPRTNAHMAPERRRIAPYLEAGPDKVLALVVRIDMGEPEPGADVVYTCPMHAEVRSVAPGRCPSCRMKLLASAGSPADDGGGQAGGDAHAHAHAHGAEADPHPPGGDGDAETRGIEWEDDMVEVNRLTTPANTTWTLIDRATGAEGGDIDWCFRVGDRVKIRLVEMARTTRCTTPSTSTARAASSSCPATGGRARPGPEGTVLVPAGETSTSCST